jgi:hypothetical protein
MITVALALLFAASFFWPASRRKALAIHFIFAVCAVAFLLYKKEVGFSIEDAEAKNAFSLIIAAVSFPAHVVMVILFSIARRIGTSNEGKTGEQRLRLFIIKYGSAYFIMGAVVKLFIMWQNNYSFNLDNWDRASFIYFSLPQKATVFIALVIIYKILKKWLAKK